MRGTRSARLAVLALLAGCGARTELFGVPPDDDAASDASFDDASGALDASPRADSGAPSRDAALDGALDSSDAIDSGEPSVVDAAPLDASVDAAAIGCTATALTPIVSTTGLLDQLALDSHTIYFHDEAGLHRVGKSGGAVTNIYPLKNFWAPDLGAFAANDDGVTFWQSHPNPPANNTFDVLHVGSTGGAPVKLATIAGMAGRGTIDNLDRTFVVSEPQNGTPSTVVEVAPDGTTSVVPSGALDASLVRSDGIDTFFSSQAGMFRVTNKGPTRIGLLQPYEYFVDFIFDGPTIYFIAYDELNNEVVGTMSKDGSVMPSILWSGRLLLSGMDQDATFIYVADRGTPAIVRIRKDGTGSDSVITGAPNVDNFNDVKVDDDCIYYSYVSYAKGGDGQSSIIAMPK
jgi:hypothetical protein